MLINVPQYTDVEDKIVGPLTMKQLGWFIVLGIILIIFWNVLPGILFFLFGFPIALLFVALAFYKPYGQPLGNFIIFGVLYFFRPKVYVWKRTMEKEQVVKKAEKLEVTNFAEKKVTSETLKNLASLLDSEGSQYNKNLDEILKKHKVQKK
ncbi:MAG: PrgI family protein [Candidatus Moranbacteria bacterium]|nr:PrgI family protein [Candidatus Moranbacteria bacterium]